MMNQPNQPNQPKRANRANRTTHSQAAGNASEFGLNEADIGLRCVVTALTAPVTAPEWAYWLEDIGFIVGEVVTVTGRSALGGDPLVVRVGASTYGLKRAEAACIRVSVAGSAAHISTASALSA